MSKIIEKYVVCRELNENLKQSIRLLYIFEDNEQVTERSGYNVFFITEEDQIYAFGNNSYAQLGFGHNRAVKEPRILSELCDKNIIAFANSLCHVIALSSYGKIFCWGSNNWGLLGIGSEENRHYKPIANLHLNNEIFIDICCGFGHSLVLTTFGEVYSWGSNNFGQIGNECNDNQITPFKVNGFRGKKVSMISCGSHHSLALTECGQVYSWGRNEFGQLGLRNTIQTNKPNLVKIVDENNYTIIIEKISCGTAHSLLLSTYGDIYLFGYNRLGQLGTGTMQDETSPKKISTNNNFIDIASHWTSKSFPFATALSFNGIYYIWGERGEEINLSPKQTNFESFIHIFAYYTQITPQVIDFEEYNTVPVLRKNKYKNDFSEKFQISSGAFGVVYKAEDKKISRNYAIKKIVLNGKGSDKTFRELKLMKKLKSRYVVEYYDSWLEENDEEQNSREKTFLLHIQMEFYSETLNAILFMLKNQLKESFELLEILSYYACSEFLIEILECVNYLHKRGVIHRDLKPENIMITKGLGERFVKLSDFGLSIMQEFYDESHTQLAGTSKYMAPEVVRTTSYGTKADIYSLGIITEELFDYTIIEKNECSEIICERNHLKKLTNRMKLSMEQQRPSCVEILNNKNLWSLNIEEKNRQKMLNWCQSFTQNENFLAFFIQKKILSRDRKNFSNMNDSINPEKQIQESKSIVKKSYFDDDQNKFVNETNQTQKLVKKKKSSKIPSKHQSKCFDYEKSILKSIMHQNGKYYNDYDEETMLGFGSFGIVCKARSKKNNKYYAIKKISLHKDYLELISREVKILSNEKSIYVVRYETSWTEDNYIKIEDFKAHEISKLKHKHLIFHPYKLLHIQMELCNNTLREIIKDLHQETNQKPQATTKPMCYYIASELFIEVLECVDYLHNQDPPIIHRDLKPSNFLITNGERRRFVKLSDFGLATHHESEDQSHTKDRGTDKYVAPEVRTTTKYNTKTDIYSLGVVAQELFNIDINCEVAENDIELKEKCTNLKSNIQDMMNPQSILRPDCDTLLKHTEDWAFKLKNVITSVDFRIFNDDPEKIEYENNFSLYFLREKWKTQNFEETDGTSMFNLIESRNYSQEFIEEMHINSEYNSNAFKCISKQDSKIYAIKKIPVNRNSSKLLLKDLERIKALDNPHIISYFSFWIESICLLDNEVKKETDNRKSSKHLQRSTSTYFNSLLYIQMEFCYKSLEQIIKIISDELNQKHKNDITPIGFFMANELFYEIIQGLIYLHKQTPPIIHRNLKPSNIMINHDGSGNFIKLSDFGLNSISNSEEHTSKRHASGASKYIAHECFGSKKFDEKSDIFSLGMIVVDLFNFDIQRTTLNESPSIFFYKEYKKMFELSDKLRGIKNNRLNIDDILSKINLEVLGLKDILDCEQYKESKKKFPNEVTIDGCFHLYFILEKLKIQNPKSCY